MKRRAQTFCEPSATVRAFWAKVKHFEPADFFCLCHGHCSHADVIDETLVLLLDEIVKVLDHPIKISSGTRCIRFNEDCGHRYNSPHIPHHGTSHAVDIHCNDALTRYNLIDAAMQLGIKHINFYKNYVHLDTSPFPPHPTIYVPDKE